ncbi:protein-L-isoaspartate O-methyltransferase family protein [Sneathiella glossodoripedis]|uniref:protein-L-isoaspartate O-methyltransferase family protein n=1 Tax=Sneathiella glossodoripedis TaxID=418853 RepID=UPI00046FE0D7|nr:protein-L-isoaspartate O-methyltransferase [Sneathiella glossodoripedis]
MTENFAQARESMVLSQLRPNRVTSDRVADAMGEIPREQFVPKALRGVAYLDEDLEIAKNRYLIEPRVFGLMMQSADVKSTDVVLDIACGSGYTSAVLGKLAQAVVAIDDQEDLVESASQTLAGLEADNVAVISGDLEAGNAKQGPYNVIHINGAIDRVPQVLFDQLAEGGRLVCVIGVNPGVAKLYVKSDGDIIARNLFDAEVPRLGAMREEVKFSL